MSDTDEGNANGEVIYEHNVNDAVVGVTYDEPAEGAATGGVTVDGYTATATISGGNGDEVRYLNWGDGTAEEQYVLSDDGDQTCHHTYAAAGTYTVLGKDSAGNVLSSDQVTITDPAPPPETEVAPATTDVDDDDDETET